jgi:hypothetical protein
MTMGLCLGLNDFLKKATFLSAEVVDIKNFKALMT